MWVCSKEDINMAKIAKKNGPIQMPLEDKILSAIVWTMMILLSIIVMYPLIFVLSSSFSSGHAVSSGKVLLWPVEFTLRGYELTFA